MVVASGQINNVSAVLAIFVEKITLLTINLENNVVKRLVIYENPQLNKVWYSWLTLCASFKSGHVYPIANAVVFFCVQLFEVSGG
jgi:hypothetical protein